MDDWLKQIQGEFSTITRDVDNLLWEMAKQGGKATEQLLDSSLEAMDDIEERVAPVFGDLSDRLDQTLETQFLYLDQHLTPWLEEVSAPVTQTINPWLQDHSACIGCRHYHGMAYGNNILVCAMYPYGPESDACKDWDSV
ncbi:hypothetical protein C1752_14873 [Acaryochloris thomasi RCC1774]|uniref:Uncharacterized protein n=1 Tax=Acaryochloris thomasi RCC1774 TaxID=1764569 RepID=A0A2W1J6S1_9CYAN|nr:hypothetical protein [Acaryochloris thomasi]PZD70260.1 hypothetical protein C1752_14873 [Acaryochloris thomasi RCC1774]